MTDKTKQQIVKLLTHTYHGMTAKGVGYVITIEDIDNLLSLLEEGEK